MGMAASQARFLGLTARKNNVEYEGQQINQQRTALSNQSGSYYTNLLGMNVPQPPSVQDYTKTIYAFSDGALNNQLTSLIAHADGSYTVSYIRNYTDNDAIVSAVPSRVTRNTETEKETTYTDADGNPLYLKDGKYYTDEDCLLEFTGDTAGITEKETEKTTTTGYAVGGTLLNNVFSKEEITDEDLADNARDDEYWKSLSTDNRKALLEDERHYLDLLNEKYSQTEGGDDWLVRYTQNKSTGAYVPTFYNKSVLDGATYDSTNTSVSYIGAYTKGAAEVSEEIKGVTAFMEQDSTGRYINITIEDGSGNLTTYALTTSTVTDEDAYNDAMNQYEYDKAQYDQDIQEINAKIEIIQSEDKDLEIRLKQLDTEQDAISNEMDAVTKVIEKNVESSFKTFG